MIKRELILACMAASKGQAYEPIQIQKLVFIFQEKAAEFLTTKPFSFQPYDYGPFDPNVYSCLETLAGEGLVQILGEPFHRRRLYKLAEPGQIPAQQVLESIKEPYNSLLITLSDLVRSITFAQLVGAVYKAFPAMKANSIFQE